MILALIVYAGWFLSVNHHLPQPFFFDPNDLQMDWYNTSFFAHRGVDAYDYWATVYPPLTFIFLKLFSKDSCYESSNDSPATLARDCDWVGQTTLYAAFLVNLLILYWIYRRRDPGTALWRTIAVGLGLPMLYALERGNVMIVCFAFFALAYGNVLRSARYRWLAIAVAINFKPYIAPSCLAFVVRRQLKRFIGTALGAVLLFLLTWTIYGSGSPAAIARDTVAFANAYTPTSFLDLWYPTTYSPVMQLFGGTFPASAIVGSDRVEWILIVLPIVITAARLAILVACLVAFLRPGRVETSRLALLLTLLALISNETGGYSQVFMLVLLFMERWDTLLQKWCIFLGYVLSLPGEVSIHALTPMQAYSYYAGRVIPLEYGVPIVSFVRPALVLVIAVCLSLDTIKRTRAEAPVTDGVLAAGR